MTDRLIQRELYLGGYPLRGQYVHYPQQTPILSKPSILLLYHPQNAAVAFVQTIHPIWLDHRKHHSDANAVRMQGSERGDHRSIIPSLPNNILLHGMYIKEIPHGICTVSKFVRQSSRYFEPKYALEDPTLEWWVFGEPGREEDNPPSLMGVVGSLRGRLFSRKDGLSIVVFS